MKSQITFLRAFGILFLILIFSIAILLLRSSLHVQWVQLQMDATTQHSTQCDTERTSKCASKPHGPMDQGSHTSCTRFFRLQSRNQSVGFDALGHFLAHFLSDTTAHPVYYKLLTHVSDDLLALPGMAGYKTLPASILSVPSPIPCASRKWGSAIPW